MTEKIVKTAEDLQDLMVHFRREFHEFPELSWTEFRTASRVAINLESMGFKTLVGEEIMCGSLMKNVPPAHELELQMERAKAQGAELPYLDRMKGGKTGVVGILETGKPGPVIAIRFDMDALPIIESDSSKHFPAREGFRSRNEGLMHSCGHDGHTAIGMGVAALLTKIRDELKGTIKLIFQPAEEGVQGGATSIIKMGVVDDADYMLSFHLGMAPLPATLFCETTGFLATTKFDINFIGKSAHSGANPEDGKSALLAAAAATMAMQGIYRHSAGASRISVGVFNSGTASNIVPDRAFLELETRGETTEINDFMKREVYRILEGAARMYDCEVDLRPEVVETGEAISAESDPELVALTKEIAEELDIFDAIEDSVSIGGSEDYTYFMERVQQKGGKALHFSVAADLKAKHHNELFDFSEDVLWKIAALLGVMIVRLK
ncbi:MAG: amidohydrolase [Clostridiales bacterium]|jgi:aminobenzoyl-glutamate utilization protein A|nr:amidohydrolase [Clostridiales bacterium]